MTGSRGPFLAHLSSVPTEDGRLVCGACGKDVESEGCER